MDILKDMVIEQIIIYGILAIFCGGIVFLYLRQQHSISAVTEFKLAQAKENGLFEPVSLYPFIDLNKCLGSGACITACPEKDILGLVDGRATAINASNCVGHGACFHACPFEAISLRIGTESRGVELPHVNQNFESNIKGIYIAGELGGMGLIKNSVEQGQQSVENMVKKGLKKNSSALDLVIIGAGPAGISAALTANEHKLKFVTLEQNTLGGTVYSFPRAKIVMTSPMTLAGYGTVKLYNTSKDELLQLWHDALSKNAITIRENTKAESIIPLQNDQFKVVTSSGEELFTQNVLIAIGRRGSPRKLNVPGEGLPKVAYRLLEPELISGKDILVVGGGDSAIEAALLLMDQNNVTLSYRKDKFSRLKPKNREKILEAVQKNSINVLFSSNVIAINENTVLLKIDDQKNTLQITNDMVYIYAGGELPVTFLQNAGIQITKRFGYIMKQYNT